MFGDEHVKFCWAAYKRGAFAEEFKRNLTPAEFRIGLLDRVSTIIGQGGDLFILKTRAGIPVGIVSVAVSSPPSAVRQMMPYVVWFPEATPRNKIECALKFLVAAKAENNLLIVARRPAWPFFRHLGKYGVLRPVGELRGYYEDGTEAMLFQGVR